MHGSTRIPVLCPNHARAREGSASNSTKQLTYKNSLRPDERPLQTPPLFLYFTIFTPISPLSRPFVPVVPSPLVRSSVGPSPLHFLINSRSSLEL